MHRAQVIRRLSRPAFTLVEMLVSAALIIFVMLILTTVFKDGLAALSQMRGVGGLQEQLRYANSVLRRDLAAPHFDREITALYGPNLSQQRLDNYDWKPPRMGFFRIYQQDHPRDGQVVPTGPACVFEERDPDGLPSYRATGDYLHFTVRLETGVNNGSGIDQVFRSKRIPPRGVTPNPVQQKSSPDYMNDSGAFFSPWAEVVYFLRANGQSTGSTPLYTLYRRRRILADVRPGTQFETQAWQFQQSPDLIADLSTYPWYSSQYMNTPTDITAPYRRLGMMQSLPGVTPEIMKAGAIPAANLPRLHYDQTVPKENAGDDILLDNVLSFEIKACWDSPRPTQTEGDARFPVTVNPDSNPTTNPDYPFGVLPLSPNRLFPVRTVRVFDTWSREKDTTAATPQYDYTNWSQGYMTDNPLPPSAAASAYWTIPLRVRVRAIQIRLRVWDLKTLQTRQVTMVQDM